MKFSYFALVVLTGTSVLALDSREEKALRARAKQLANSFIIVDTHVDTPYRVHELPSEDLSKETKGDFDFIKGKNGGLNAPFMSIYVPASYEREGGAKQLADNLIDLVESFQTRWPNNFAIATSVADVRAHYKKGLISLPMGMENGAPVEGKLENLKHFYDRGIRYITLTHSESNHICDSSYDEKRLWNGLSPFGEKVIEEMNRLGIMVDISHASDNTFYEVIEKSKAPVIASHSSCRYYTPGFERNMSDEMIRKLAEKNGVIMINFGSSFINKDSLKIFKDSRAFAQREIEKHSLSKEEGAAVRKKYLDEHFNFADVKEVAAHIDHVVKMVGAEHVGFGSDFDGVGDSLPVNLKDSASYPNLIYELLKKGYSDEDLEKICSANLLRVWSEVERIAKNH